MRKSLAVGTAIVAVAFSFGLAACGSSDDSSGDTLSKSDLITQADQVCSKYNDQLTDLQADSGLNAGSSKEEIVAFISDEIVPLYKDELADLRELNPSEDDSEAFNDILDTLETELNQVEDDPAATISESSPFAGASAKAKEFGLTVCGSN